MESVKTSSRFSVKFIATWGTLAIASSLLSSSPASAVSYTKMNLSTGIHMEELRSPIFYETFIPVIYEYNVPRYTALDVTLRDWREKCKTESFSPSYTCPVFFHYEKYLERFEAEVVPKAWVKDASPPHTNVPSVPRTTYDFCSTIQPHFPGSITQQFGFEEYIEKLQKCPLGDILITRGINDYIYNVKELFKSMNKNYENEFSNSFIQAGNSKLTPAFYVNAVTTHQNGMLIAYLLEMNRWSEAELACNSHLIPKSLVRIENFTNSLDKLGQLLTVHSLVSSINTEETSSFYKMPVTDCSYIENAGTFVVRIQIPVMKKGLNPTLFRLRPISFIFKDDFNKDSSSSVTNLQLCQIQADFTTTYIYDKLSGVLQTSKCNNPSSPFCKLESFVSSDIMGPCISSIFSESLEGVRKYCEMVCTPWKENGLKMLPAFHQIQPDTWIVTGHLLTGVAIKCQGKQDKVLEHPDVGALQIKLPCNCYLAYHIESYYPESSCEENIEPIITNILPVSFIRSDKLDEVQTNILAYNKDNTNTTFSITGSNLIISSVSGKSFDGYGAQTSAHVSEADSNEGGGGNLTFMWVVLIIQLICLIGLAAVPTYKYVERRRKLNAFSKERLVYNAYPSTSNQNISSPSASSSTDTYPYSQRSSVTENNLNIL